MPLVLTRKPGQALKIGDNITVTVVRINGDQASIAIDAPRDVPIVRDDAIKREAPHGK